MKTLLLGVSPASIFFLIQSPALMGDSEAIGLQTTTVTHGPVLWSLHCYRLICLAHETLGANAR